MLEKNISTFGQTYTTSPAITDIFVIAGQSNAYLGGLPDRSGDQLNVSIDVSGGSVFQMSVSPATAATYGDILAADEPLKHPVPQAGAIGFGLPFARDYFVPANSGAQVLLVPYAVSATGFSDNRWNPSDDLFLGMCNAIGVAQRLAPNATLRGMLWMQGEKEAQAGWTQGQYATAFDAMVTAFRAQFGQVPVIVGGMRPGWVAANAGAAPITAALVDTPNRLALTAYANPNSAPVIGNGDTGVHYGASEQRAFAARWWTAYQAALADT